MDFRTLASRLKIKNRVALTGWLLIAVGTLSIIAVGFFHPTQPPMHLAERFWALYSAAVVMIAAGMLLVTDS